MVAGLAFLSKKSWHVKNIANQEKVWVAEQREEQEKAKAKELAKQIQQEREQEELDKIAGKSSSTRKDRGIDWMYHGHEKESEIAKQDAEKKAEEYLLGKEFVPDTVKGDLAAAAEETQGVNAVVEAGGAIATTTEEEQDAKMPAWSEPSVAEKNEAFRMRHEDPMFAVSHTEMRKRQEIEKKKELFEKVTGQSVVAVSRDKSPDSDSSDYDKSKSRSRKERKRHKKEKKARRKERKARKRERRERRRHYSDSEEDDYESDYQSDKEFRSRRRRSSPEPREESRDRHSDRHADRDRHYSRKRYHREDDDYDYSRRRGRHDDDYTQRRSRRDDEDSERQRNRPKNDQFERDTRRHDRDEFGREYPRDRRGDDHNRDGDHKRRRTDHLDDRQHDQRSFSHKPKPPPPASESQAQDVKPAPTKQAGYGLQGASTVPGDNPSDLGPDLKQLQRKREAREAERQKHRERSVKRNNLTAEERAEKVRAMQNHADERFVATDRGRPESTEADGVTPQSGQASFLSEMTRQVHGVSNSNAESLSDRIAQNSMSNQRRHEGFL